MAHSRSDVIRNARVKVAHLLRAVRVCLRELLCVVLRKRVVVQRSANDHHIIAAVGALALCSRVVLFAKVIVTPAIDRALSVVIVLINRSVERFVTGTLASKCCLQCARPIKDVHCLVKLAQVDKCDERVEKV